MEQAMATRTAKRTVTFTQPFRVGEFGEQLPAGRYPVETDEELLEGVSFLAYRRTATVMQLTADSGGAAFATIDPAQLAEALAADITPAPISIDPPMIQP
jgi:hypothetical protein